jgi:hypothetical protein
MYDERDSPLKAEKQAVAGFIASLQPPYTPNNGIWLSIPRVKKTEDHIFQLIPDTEYETLEKPQYQVQRLKKREDQQSRVTGVYTNTIYTKVLIQPKH